MALTFSEWGVAVSTSSVVLTTSATTGMIAGSVIGAITGALTKGTTGVIVGNSATIGGTASAIFGSAAASKAGAVGTGVLTGAGLASVTGAGAAAAISSVYAGATSLMTGPTAGILSGPVGWIVLGTTAEQSSGIYTYDCWKPILHDDSSEPSHGKTLREIAMDPRIKQVLTTANENNANFPHLVLQNVWDEQFRIDYVYLPSNELAAHAVKI